MCNVAMVWLFTPNLSIEPWEFVLINIDNDSTQTVELWRNKRKTKTKQLCVKCGLIYLHVAWHQQFRIWSWTWKWHYLTKHITKQIQYKCMCDNQVQQSIQLIQSMQMKMAAEWLIPRRPMFPFKTSSGPENWLCNTYTMFSVGYIRLAVKWCFKHSTPFFS